MSRSIAFFASHAAGGIRELWADLAAGFAERGDRTRLIALYPYEPESEAKDAPRWSYLAPDKPAGPAAKLKMLRNLARWLRRDRPDFIVTAMPAANVLIPLFARIFSPNTIVLTSHHSPVETHNPRLNTVDSQIGRLANVRAIVCVSAAVRDSLARKPAAYRAKSHTIHNALPRSIARVLAEIAPVRATRTPGRSAVAAGRLAPQKNYPMLVRAAALMPDVTIDILGSGPDEVALKAHAAGLNVADRVRFLGQRDRARVLALIARADVFVQMSLFEGHSLALLEASSLGLPLVVSDVASQVEGVTARDGTRCGIVVALDDDAGLARAVLSLVDDPAEYRRWTELSARLAREATFDAMIARYDTLMR